MAVRQFILITTDAPQSIASSSWDNDRKNPRALKKRDWQMQSPLAPALCALSSGKEQKCVGSDCLKRDGLRA
jgi:hypothetical protein